MPFGKKSDLGSAAIVVLLCVVQIAVWYQVVLAREEKFDQQIDQRLSKVISALQEEALCVQLYSQRYVSAGDDFYLIAPVEHSATSSDTISNYWQLVDTLKNPVNRSRFQMELPALVDLSVRMQFLVPRDSDENDLSDFQKEALSELKTSLWTNIDGNSIKLLDTIVLKNTIQEAFLIEPIKEINSAIINRKTEEIQFAFGTTRMASAKTNFAPLFPVETEIVPWDLHISFPNKRMAFMWDASPILLASFVVVALLLIWLWNVQKSMRAKRRLATMQLDLVSSISHEFNTPITNISFALETILKGGDINQKDGERLLNVIKDANVRMDTNVKKIMAVTLFQNEKFILEKEPHDIHEVLDRAAELSRPALEKNQSVLIKNYSSQASWIDLDATYMVNVITSLIENSVKHGGTEVTLELRTSDDDNGVWIDVLDNGPGIPKKERSLVFEKFYRIEATDRKYVNGTGIGLYFTKLVVEAHGGTIKAIDHETKGARIQIHLKKNEINED